MTVSRSRRKNIPARKPMSAASHSVPNEDFDGEISQLDLDFAIKMFEAEENNNNNNEIHVEYINLNILECKSLSSISSSVLEFILI